MITIIIFVPQSFVTNPNLAFLSIPKDPDNANPSSRWPKLRKSFRKTSEELQALMLI